MKTTWSPPDIPRRWIRRGHRGGLAADRDGCRRDHIREGCRRYGFSWHNRIGNPNPVPGASYRASGRGGVGGRDRGVRWDCKQFATAVPFTCCGGIGLWSVATTVTLNAEETRFCPPEVRVRINLPLPRGASTGISDDCTAGASLRTAAALPATVTERCREWCLNRSWWSNLRSRCRPSYFR